MLAVGSTSNNILSGKKYKYLRELKEGVVTFLLIHFLLCMAKSKVPKFVLCGAFRIRQDQQYVQSHA